LEKKIKKRELKLALQHQEELAISAVEIQRVVRGRAKRRQFQSLQSAKGACVIQKAWRKAQSIAEERARARNQYIWRQQNCIKIQRQYKQHSQWKTQRAQQEQQRLRAMTANRLQQFVISRMQAERDRFGVGICLLG
jgi:hypothetical protein